MKDTTQEMLDKAYHIAIDVLAAHFRSYIEKHLLNVPLTSEEEELVKNLTWRPVAQEFVVTMLQPLFTSAAESGALVITKKDLAQTWLKDITPERLAEETGLVGEDVVSAMKAVAEAIYASAIFRSPCALYIDGKLIMVTRQA